MKLLTALFIAILALCPHAPEGAAQSDYKYLDEEDNEIIFPVVSTVWTQSFRGPWSEEQARWHLPRVEARFRKDGLENIRFVTLTFEHPPGKSKEGAIKNVYLRDKDELIVGYRAFGLKETAFEFRTRLNGVVNYLDIHVFCAEHGVWKSEVRLPLDKT